MSMVDIKNYRKYSSKKLQELAYKGLLECNGADLSSFLEYFCKGLISEKEAERIAEIAGQEGYEEGYGEGRRDGYSAGLNACEIDRD